LLYSRLFGDDEASGLFSDAAELRDILLVEGALARVQGALGVIPPAAAAFIDRASRQVMIDPATLAEETGQNGVPVPAVLAAFRKAAGSPELMQHLHWGATSQDIMDTALALRLKRLLDRWQARLDAALQGLAGMAETHAALPMVARTYGQAATPTSFGAVVAGWGWPLLSQLQALPALRDRVQTVSLSGAAGTLSAMGEDGPRVRAALARELGLADPCRSWHTDRTGIGALAGWMATTAGAFGKMGEDLILLAQSGLAEVRISGGGASSTMPQKQNPVAPSALVALGRAVIGLSATLQGAGMHRQQRDGAAWFTEWLTLPQSCILTSRGLAIVADLVDRMDVDAEAMHESMEAGGGLIHAEALTFALARRMPRPEAQVVVKELCREVERTGIPLPALAAREWPDEDWNKRLSSDGLGQAPAEARAFASMRAGK
jgi:3-carboxy-cis,cis-muconate cycloisomerase